ncbi:MAG: hypothetical protein H6561_17010 [Lewinellaceae bacterium]|nr:hypothetical protein [Lewinellaceae bacterium]
MIRTSLPSSKSSSSFFEARMIPKLLGNHTYPFLSGRKSNTEVAGNPLSGPRRLTTPSLSRNRPDWVEIHKVPPFFLIRGESTRGGQSFVILQLNQLPCGIDQLQTLVKGGDHPASIIHAAHRAHRT